MLRAGTGSQKGSLKQGHRMVSYLGYPQLSRRRTSWVEATWFLSNWFSSSCIKWAPQVALVVKNLPIQEIPGSGRSPGGGRGNPLLYFCLENPMDGRNWKATVHRVAQNLTLLKQHTLACMRLVSGNVLIWGGCLWNACLGNQNLKFRLFYLYYMRLGTWCFSRQCVLSIYSYIFHPNSICTGHTCNPLSAVWRQS